MEKTEHLRGIADLAIRVGPLAPSSLVSRRLCAFPMLTVCAPTFCKPAPGAPDELDADACFVLHERSWDFERNGKRVSVQPRGRIRSTSGALLVQAAIGDAGIAQVPSYFCATDLQAGRLVQLLPTWSAGEMESFMLYPEQRHLPARVRMLIDFLGERHR